MKNKYFGDVNDYKKYGILRALTGPGEIATTVCWILTEDDDSGDGRRIGYLSQPEEWREHDPEVFDHLQLQVLQHCIRSVDAIESADVLPNCRFYSALVRDDMEARQHYFYELLKFAKGSQLVFFDPDNGLEVKSVPSGRKNSSKYIYWEEIKQAFAAGHSLLIYQHLPRKPRVPFITQLVDKFRATTGVRNVLSYCTSHVVFFLLPQAYHEEHFKERSNVVVETWGQRISVRHHVLLPSVPSATFLATQPNPVPCGT